MPKLVLIVDDDPAQRRILEETIKRLGFETKTAQGGEQALQILEGPIAAPSRSCCSTSSCPASTAWRCCDALAPQAGHPADHRADRARLDRCRHHRHARRRRRLRRQADLARAPRGVDQERAQDRGAAGRDHPHQEEGRRHADLRRPHRARRSHAARHRARPPRRRLQHPGADRGRERRRQGADRARHPGRERARARKPFVTVNCGAIPENLVESILFGHEKGSFTGAVDKRIGKFQEADGGTLFLDEIGELPLDAQVKLLRALQDGEIDPVGSKKPVKVDFRLISATNRDMIQLVKDGKFREDLYYRLNVFPIWVPPLRERLEDVPELALHFLARFAAEEGRRVNGIGKDALRAAHQLLRGPATCASSRTPCSAPSCWPTGRS